jgi:hypothetical protein
MSRIAGSSLLSVFDQEVTRRDAARRTIENQIAAEERRISAANAEREAAYTELAEMYAADQGKLGADFGEISQRLQRIFDEKMQRRREVNGLLDQAANLIAGLQAQVAPAQEKEHAAHEQLDETMRAVEAQLAEDSTYLVLKREADELQGTWQQLKAAHGRVCAEAETKLAAYRGNRLFQYLITAKYGLPEYPRTGLVAAGDRWVAGLVGWEKNFPPYLMLRELPAFAEKRAIEAQKRAELAGTKVAFHVHECEVARQVDAARAALAAATQARQQIEAQVAQLEEKRAKLVAEVQAMDAGGDEFQQRAKAEMKAFLTANPIAVLKAKAEATAQPRDNQLVDQIERAEAAINEGRKRVKAMIEERTEAERQHQRAITARRKFSSDYTGRYDQFDPAVNLNGLLTGYILGTMSDQTLWGRVSHHYYDATPTYAYASPSSDSGGFSFGGFSGGDSSGGFSTGGGSGGGGFSTGGGS